MKTAIALLVTSVLTVFAITAKAATIQNLDESPYELRVIESGQERTIALLPGANATDLCKTKCELYIGADPDPYELVSADELVIEGGQLFENAPQQDNAPKQ